MNDNIMFDRYYCIQQITAKMKKILADYIFVGVHTFINMLDSGRGQLHIILLRASYGTW